MRYVIVIIVVGLLALAIACSRKQKQPEPKAERPPPAPVKGRTFHDLVASPPRVVAWSELGDLDQMDQRRMSVEMIQGTIIGVIDNAVEFAPDNDPPSQDEVLCWIWFLRPDLADEVRAKAAQPLRELMDSHRNGTMDKWWKQFGKRPNTTEPPASAEPAGPAQP